MKKFLSELTKEFRLVTPESFYAKNIKPKIVYPYLTYKVGTEDLGTMIDGVYVDVDIIDSSTSYANLWQLEQDLKEHFKKDILINEMLIRYSFIRSNEIDMLDDLLKRRSLQFYCKIYRR